MSTKSLVGMKSNLHLPEIIKEVYLYVSRTSYKNRERRFYEKT